MTDLLARALKRISDRAAICRRDNYTCATDVVIPVPELLALADHLAEYYRPRAALKWATETFGPVAADPTERGLRFLEEAIELYHAFGLDFDMIEKIAVRVYDRPQGVIGKEIGQAQLTLELLSELIGISARAKAAEEFARVQAIPKAEWERRHLAKQLIGIAR